MILGEAALRALPQPPFRTTPVYGKGIRIDRLPAVENARFQRIFGSFLTPPVQGVTVDRLKNQGFDAEPPFKLRRFAGGRALPRGRYYAVCEDHGGFSSQTLAMELLSYAAIDPNFELEVVDLSDPSRAAFIPILDPATRQLCAQWNDKVLVACQRHAGFYPEAEHDPSHPARSLQFLVLPFEITKIESKGILDLREKAAMEWLLTLLWEHFPSVAFIEDPSVMSHDAAYEPVPLVVESTEDFNELLRKQTNLRDVGLGGLPKHDDPLRAFLYYALHPAHGGSPVVDLMAAALQRFGVECLIFPSARHDCGVDYVDGRVAASIGWNLVDYRDFTSDYTSRHVFVLEHVSFWQKPRGLLKMGASKALYGVESWGMLGLSDETHRTYRELMWRDRIADRPNIALARPVLAERLPWRGRGAAPRAMPPRLIRTWRELQIALIIEEIELDGMMREAEGEAGVPIGSYMAELSTKVDAWGFGAAATAYEKDAWCLVQSDQAFGHRVICPGCGEAQEESIHATAFLLYCRSCFLGRSKLDEVGEEAVMDAVNRAIDRL